ncbi:MAG TPA: alpha/beta fold hydrolase, partial [Ornithinibacter sp.]|nr:alpha/beta fold hydrolase [Ornithinibacter sp.]
MTSAQLGDVTIEYELDGPDDGEPMLLVMGLGAQLVAWPRDLVDGLADRGFRVIRMDNRDIGLSTKTDTPAPTRAALFKAFAHRRYAQSDYLLSDMAADAVALLDHLGVGAAHVVGVSMGGMIAQRMAIHFPARVRSLTSIMSSTGNPGLPQGDPKVIGMLTSARPTTPAEAVEFGINMWRVLSGPGFAFDEKRTRDLVIESGLRSSHMLGQPRQMLAIVTDGDRREALHGLKVPTLVLHGDADPLVPFAAGKDTAENIPGARLVPIQGMGHSLPEGAWPLMLDEITRL